MKQKYHKIKMKSTQMLLLLELPFQNLKFLALLADLRLQILQFLALAARRLASGLAGGRCILARAMA